jgi:hypothetical protein
VVGFGPGDATKQKTEKRLFSAFCEAAEGNRKENSKNSGQIFDLPHAVVYTKAHCPQYLRNPSEPHK